jgi:hypothetical protein
MTAHFSFRMDFRLLGNARGHIPGLQLASPGRIRALPRLCGLSYLSFSYKVLFSHRGQRRLPTHRLFHQRNHKTLERNPQKPTSARAT